MGLAVQVVGGGGGAVVCILTEMAEFWKLDTLASNLEASASVNGKSNNI